MKFVDLRYFDHSCLQYHSLPNGFGLKGIVDYGLARTTFITLDGAPFYVKFVFVPNNALIARLELDGPEVERIVFETLADAGVDLMAAETRHKSLILQAAGAPVPTEAEAEAEDVYSGTEKKAIEEPSLTLNDGVEQPGR